MLLDIDITAIWWDVLTHLGASPLLPYIGLVFLFAIIILVVRRAWKTISRS